MWTLLQNNPSLPIQHTRIVVAGRTPPDLQPVADRAETAS